jgi:acyl-CoA thioesterase FadM
LVVFFRLATALVGSSLRPRIGPFDVAALRMRVWPNDLDLNMHASSGRYVSFMDIGRVDLLVRTGVFRKVVARGWRPIVGGSMITYRRSLFLFERFTVKSRVVGWDEKWLYFDHVIEKSNGELAVKAKVRGILRGPNGNVPPRDLAQLSGYDGDSPPLPESIVRWREAEARERTG